MSRRFRVDTSPLRDHADFRRLFIANLITGLGSGATYVALPFQVAELTGSYLHVGVIGALEPRPVIRLATNRRRKSAWSRRGEVSTRNRRDIR